MLLPGALCGLIAILCILASGVGRRYVGVTLIAFAGLLLIITIASACGGSITMLLIGAPASICLGWIGYTMHRRGPPPTPADVVMATLATPTPTARDLQRADVLGAWRFYVDAATSTVSLELRGGGRFYQQIVRNGGETVDCPGGTWSLDGPYLTLTGYQSVTSSQTKTVRWFFGDWQNELVLLVQDAPETGTILIAQREALARA